MTVTHWLSWSTYVAALMIDALRWPDTHIPRID